MATSVQASTVARAAHSHRGFLLCRLVSVLDILMTYEMSHFDRNCRYPCL